MTLPPGQQLSRTFPRFGSHGDRPPPPVPADPEIEIAGAVTQTLAVRLAALSALPRRELTADFHCVAGWSAANLRWEGVAFAAFYRAYIEPALRPGTEVTHLVFEGLDGYRSIVLVEDALAAHVLLAQHLDGQALDGDHGAPIRLLSPGQYGYLSTKHLCRIEVHTTEPAARYHPDRVTQLVLQLLRPHPRARVSHEERHRYLPAPVLRLIGRLVRTVGPLSNLDRRP